MPASIAQILDLMEYANDGAAQAAFVTSATGGYGSDILNGGTVSSRDHYSGQTADLAVDNNTGTYYQAVLGDSTEWWKYDLGSGITKQVQQLILTIMAGYFGAFDIQGSNNDSSWTTIYSGTASAASTTFTFTNNNSYRYYRLYGLVGSAGNVVLYEVEMMEALTLALQDYSEASIKQEGSYALKGVAAITDSLNKTLTRTVSPVINLSDKTIIKFDIRASRTGSNIKIGIHDSGGTTTEITPVIATADTWQTVVWDISAVTNANKDAINSIIITIVNADADNTFYIDNMFADIIYNYLIHRGRDRFRIAGYSLG